MNLYFRLLLTWLRNLPGPAHHFTHNAKSAFRGMPLDLDVFGHMNNGRFRYGSREPGGDGVDTRRAA